MIAAAAILVHWFDAPTPAVRATPAVVFRFRAPEARQGVAGGTARVYAIDNSKIAAYDKRSAKRIGTWAGDPERFQSCSRISA